MNNNKTRLAEKSTKQIFYADQTNFFKISNNGGTTSSDGTKVSFNEYGRMNFMVNFDQFHKYSQIKSIKIRVKSTSSGTSFTLNQEQTMDSRQNAPYSYHMADSNGYCEVDVINYCYASQGYRNYFSLAFLIPSTIYTKSISTNAYKPQLIVEYIDDKESIANQKMIEGNAGRALNYQVNARTGRPIYTKSLLNINTTVMPINLGLYYDPLLAETIDYNMPKGWRFTYDLSLTSNTEGYEYRDGNGLRHQFVKALNNSSNNNVYYDIAGTGLILTKTSDSYIIEDGYNNFIKFDLWNHVTKVSKKIYDSNNVLNEFGLTFTYTTGTDLLETISEENTISGTTTTDEKVTINYSSSAGGIEITSTGFPSIVIKKDSSNYLTQIIEEDNRTCSYTYTDNGLLATAYSDNGEKVVFTYDSRYRVKTITESVNSETNITSKRTIDYGYLTTHVTNYFGNKKGYSFDGEGTLIAEFEEDKNKSAYIDKTDEAIKTDNNQGDEYFLYNNVSITGNKSSANNVTRTVAAGNLTLDTTNKFRLSFVYNFEALNEKASNAASYISVKQNGQTLATKYLDLKRISDTLCNLEFKCSNTAALSVYVVHNYNTCKLNVKNIVISKKNPKECYLCTSKKFNNETQYGTSGNPFYPYDKTTFRYNTSTNVSGNMYYEDLVENQKNIALNSSSHHIWYNKKRGLVANTSNVLLNQNGSYVSLSGLKCGTVTIEKNQVHYDYSEYSNDNTINNQLLKTTKSISVDGCIPFIVATEYINKQFQTIKKKDSKNTLWSLVVDSSYDKYGNLISEKTSNTADSKYILTNYNFEKMILKSKVVYINGVAATTTYTVNSNTGLLEKITYPDGSVNDYSYCDNTIGKLKSLSQTVDSKLNSNELTYSKDKVTNYKGINTGLTLEYDGYNEVSKFKNASSTIWSKTTSIATSGIEEHLWFGSSSSFNIKNQYDTYGNLIIRKESNGGSSYSNALKFFYSDLCVDDITATAPTDSSLRKSSGSKVRRIEDEVILNTKDLYYNEVGNVTKETNSNDNYKPGKIECSYDSINRLTLKIYDNSYRKEGINYAYIFGDMVSGQTSMLKYYTGSAYKTINSNVSYERDYLDRIVKETITTVDSKKLIRQFTYVDTNNMATNLIQTIKLYKDSTLVDTLTYTYDSMGRITKVSNTSNSINNTYKYDKLGRLVRENNKELNKSFSFVYDKNGNIISKSEGAYTEGTVSNTSTKTLSYSSTYSDELIKYNGQTVSVSTIGNITAIGSTNYTWSKGTLLTRVYKSSYQYSDYAYDGMGVRFYKSVYNNGVTEKHEYVCDGNRILKETITGGSYAGTLNYIYLGNQVVGFTYKTKEYFFQKNLQGDIIKIYDNTNTLVASYKYDAWGNCTITSDTNSIGTINPFRYRGYYYDRESNLYYCNARYYNPEILRWMSLDSLEYLEEDRINGCNLYAYCGNDPINNVDPSGNLAIVIGVSAAALIKGIAMAAAAIAASVAVANIEKETHAISNSLNALQNAIEDVTDDIKDLIITYTAALIVKRNYGTREDHHIVAQKDPRAWVSRIILKDCGIDINDSRNIAKIRKEYHKVIHTNLYYGILNTSMGVAYFIGGKQGVVNMLGFYKIVLEGL